MHANRVPTFDRVISRSPNGNLCQHNSRAEGSVVLFVQPIREGRGCSGAKGSDETWAGLHRLPRSGGGNFGDAKSRWRTVLRQEDGMFKCTTPLV